MLFRSIALDTIVKRIATLRPADRRGVVHRLRRGVVLLDDSYNSSPSALRTTLEVVRTDRSAARKVAVLGEMLELGDHAVALHQEIGRLAAASAIDRLFVVGGPAAEALAETAAAAMADGAVRYFRTSEEAAEPVASAIEPGDLVLVKGSRGTRTDRVADRIVAEWA